MSLSSEPISQSAIAGQPAQAATTTTKRPRKRLVISKADRTSQPEPR